MIEHHLPALQVLLPLSAAPLVMFLARWPTLAWAFTTTVCYAAFFVAILLLGMTWTGITISYAHGGWEPPWGIEYRVDGVNAFVLLIVSGISALVMPYARRSVEQEVATTRIAWFYAAFLLANAGLIGITITGDAFNIFVFFEISAIASYALIAMGRHRRAALSSFNYLIMGTIGTTFLLIGIGFLYMMTGTLNLADLASRLPDVYGTKTIRTAFAFIAVGVSLKLALFPLHLWLPNAYTYAPTMVTVFLSATATKVAIYVLLRFFYSVFGADFSFEILPMSYVLMPLALLGILIPSVVAIFQDDVKRMLAYSSVAQVGYIILGFSLANTLGVTAAVVHLFNHALTKAALFMALGAIVYRIGSARLERMAGIARDMPWTLAAFVVGGLGLIGVPLTAGFVTKLHLLLALLDSGLWPLVVFLLLTSLMAVVYIGRVVEAAYFRTRPATATPVREAPLVLLIPTWTLALASLVFGIYTALPLGAASRAASILVGVQT
ncbi:MAG: monovalent cation/H+ antiporter subunit D family protein [Thiotrichales bacterium]